MNEQIVNREALPEHLLARIQSSKIVVREDNGSFVLTPLKPETGIHGSLWAAEAD